MSHPPLPSLLRQLVGRIGGGPKLGLDTVRQALVAVGSPHHALAAVHVAGTNGKGSVCAMLESVARAAGLSTGMYTSPHLCRFNERIRIDGQPIDDQRFAKALAAALADHQPPLTFFEAMTVAAFAALADAQVDLAIIEVGLGGRLDATNVLERPLVTAITSIGVDHTAYLGDDVTTIAFEKAGILKPACPLVLGPVTPQVERAIRRVAEHVGAGPIRRIRRGADAAGDSIAVESTPDGRVDIRGLPTGALRVRPALAGPHQACNAAVVAGLVEVLDARAAPWRASTGPLRAHLAAGLEQTHWPGRLERIQHRGRSVILDGAHNVAATRTLCAALAERCTAARTTLVFGAMQDKPWPEMLDLLGRLAETRFYTEPLPELAGRRPVAPERLAGYLPGEIIDDPRAAIAAAISRGRMGDTVLVTGSIFLVGAVRAALLGLQQDLVLPL